MQLDSSSEIRTSTQEHLLGSKIRTRFMTMSLAKLPSKALILSHDTKTVCLFRNRKDKT
jgi:hypothetical protein